ncbi:MAG: alpha-amylase family glycosyl hydrolase [Thiolinea sp.]
MDMRLEKMAKNQVTKQLGGDADWWRRAVIYQIYPRSYMDSNGDGIGDLPGIVSKLDYLQSLNIDAIWISPFFTSPMKDFGYDVSDYCDVDPMFGTLADFDELIEQAHQRGIRILIDLVLSHTSDQHAWFKESRGSRDNAKADWYVWADPKPDGTPPTNWLSIFGGSAWEWDAVRRQYYMHNFLVSQPDLNFHNPQVQDALLEVTRFWLERGVDGFRLDTANMYTHDAELRDNPPIQPGGHINGIDVTNPYAMQDPVYNINRPETPVFMERFRALLDQYPATTSVGELGAVRDMYSTIATYTEQGKRLHMAYSFDFMTTEYSAAHVTYILKTMQQRVGSGWPCWAFSNHDVMRVVSRWGTGPQGAAMLIAMLTSMGGSACVYQGEELGFPEAEVAFEDLQDPFGIRFWPGYKGRDGCRTPIAWEAEQEQGGFSSAKPWLPVVTPHKQRAVNVQDADVASTLNQVRQFLGWRRQQAALLSRELEVLDAPENVVAFVCGEAGKRLLCAFNLQGVPVVFDSAKPDLQAVTGHGFEACADCDGGVISLAAHGVFFGTWN